MTFYNYISAPTTTDWYMDPDVFVAHFKERWPNGQIRPVTDQCSKYFSHEWRLQISGHTIMGKFNKMQPGVVFCGCDLVDGAAFAAWFRSIIPIEQPLIFSDDGLDIDIELTPNITESEIITQVLK